MPQAHSTHAHAYANYVRAASVALVLLVTCTVPFYVGRAYVLPVSLALVHLLCLQLWVIFESSIGVRDAFNPFLLFLAASFLHFVGPSFFNASINFQPVPSFSYVAAHVIVSVFVILVLCGYVLSALSEKWVLQRKGTRIEIHHDSRHFLRNDLCASRLYLVIVLLYLFVSSIALMTLVLQAGGIREYLAALALRLEFFRGKGVLLSLAIISIPAAILSYAAMMAKRTRTRRLIFLASFLIATVSGILTGSRGVVIMLLLQLVVIRHYLSRSITHFAAAVLAGFGFIFLIGYVFVVRQPGLLEQEGLLRSNLVTESFQMLYGKGTFIELNSVARTIHNVPARHDLSLGSTYVAALTFPFPRLVVGDKWASGSEAYTKSIRPEIWASGRGDRVTVIGEAIMNFGYPAVPIVAFAIGVLIRRTYRRLVLGSSGSILRPCMYACFIVFLLALIRGDFASAIFQYLRVLLPIVIPFVLVGTLRDLLRQA